MKRQDWLSAAVLFAVTVAIFAPGAGRLGFYADDAGWLATLPHIDTAHYLWRAMWDYMPGRHLHPFWHYLSYRMAGGDPLAHLPALHVLQATLDGLVVAAFFLLLRRLDVPAHASVLAAALFAFWPIHGETHFWLESIPMNLLSTLFLVLWALTSLALASGRRAWWLWALDVALFGCALFTYDQVFFVLALLAAMRVLAVRSWSFRLPHLAHVAAGAFYLCLKLTRPGGPRLPEPARLLETLRGNFRHSLWSTVGRVGLDHVRPLFARVTPLDWMLAALVAATVAGLVLWRFERPPAAAPYRGRLFALALLVWAAAYLPVWLWYVSPRHHYLPSLGLFTGVAVALSWRRVPAPLLVMLAGGILLGAAANRGESRYWEAAFTAKRRLFSEIRPSLRGREILVLENFPQQLATAFLIAPHDAHETPALLVPQAGLGRHFQGFLGHAPAPGGMFVSTHPLDGPETFRYTSSAQALIVRFDSWDNGRLQFRINPDLPLPYQAIAGKCLPREAAAFAVRAVRTRRDGPDLVASLDFAVGPRASTWLAVVFTFFHWDHFEPWGERDRQGNINVWPILLAEPGPGCDCTQTLRLPAFPASTRLRLDFYAVSRDRPPALLGRVEAPVAP